MGPHGTNKVMEGESIRLAKRALTKYQHKKFVKKGTGTLLAEFDPQLALVLANYHRTSSKVLMDLYCSNAKRLETLYQAFKTDASTDERGWCRDGQSISVAIKQTGDFPASSGQMIGTVKNAIIDGLAEKGISLTVSTDDAEHVIVVRNHEGEISVSLDMVGFAKHLRGYRIEQGAAPLRENIAATLLMLARWDSRKENLWDPMCGSGTIAIEAALAANAPPMWEARELACIHNPIFEESFTDAGALFTGTEPKIFASDKDPQQIRNTKSNAKRASVQSSIVVEKMDLFDQTAPPQFGHGHGLILTNPPYNKRLETSEAFFEKLGAWSRKQKGYRFACLVDFPEFERHFGARARIKKPLYNGSLGSYFYLFDSP